MHHSLTFRLIFHTLLVCFLWVDQKIICCRLIAPKSLISTNDMQYLPNESLAGPLTPFLNGRTNNLLIFLNLASDNPSCCFCVVFLFQIYICPNKIFFWVLILCSENYHFVWRYLFLNVASEVWSCSTARIQQISIWIRWNFRHIFEIL